MRPAPLRGVVRVVAGRLAGPLTGTTTPPLSRRSTHGADRHGEADPTVPIIRVTRDLAASPAQLFRAHADPELFVRWVGPDEMTTTLDRWDASTGGSWRYVAARDGEEFGFHGCFHEVRPDRIVQTFT